MRGDGKEEGREGYLGGQSRSYTVREKKGSRRSGAPPAGRLDGPTEEQGTQAADDLQLSYRGLAASKFFAAHKAAAPLSVVAFPPPCPSPPSRRPLSVRLLAFPLSGRRLDD